LRVGGVAERAGHVAARPAGDADRAPPLRMTLLDGAAHVPADAGPREIAVQPPGAGDEMQRANREHAAIPARASIRVAGELLPCQAGAEARVPRPDAARDDGASSLARHIERAVVGHLRQPPPRQPPDLEL